MIKTEVINWEQHGTFISDYRESTEKAMRFFEYKPYESLQQRHDYLMKKTFPREKLVSAIKEMHEKWDAPEHSYTYTENLLDEKSTVVIGGQQAGLLTGPLYSINKLISIIKFSKEQEESLKKPVLPVFWIAGEDHDFEEVNHAFIQEKNKLRKHRIHQLVKDRATVSSTSVDHSLLGEWIDVVFSTLQETEHAKEVYEMVQRCLDASETYVDFFARMVFALLPNESFILIDSADPLIRKIEQPFFEHLIEHQQSIASSIYQTDHMFTREGYDSIVEVAPNDGHLFYHLNDERILLERDTRNNWVGKQKEVIFTNEELLKIAKTHPELLSNNVVTRPLMQDMLFPTLAFMGGNGEITYWALLKEAFQVSGLQMPPVVPRLSFTYIDKKTAHTLEKLNISIEEAVQGAARIEKMNFLRKQTSPPINSMMSEFKKQMEELYKPLHMFAKEIRVDIGELSEANEQIVLKELAYLEKRMDQAIKEPLDKTLELYDYIDNMLYPHGGLQERVWNPVPFLVGQGIDLFEHVLNESFDFKQPHYAIFI